MLLRHQYYIEIWLTVCVLCCNILVTTYFITVYCWCCMLIHSSTMDDLLIILLDVLHWLFAEPVWKSDKGLCWQLQFTHLRVKKYESDRSKYSKTCFPYWNEVKGSHIIYDSLNFSPILCTVKVLWLQKCIRWVFIKTICFLVP